ncbi:MAG: Ankyrin-2 [Peltula sp. TS41687]|nr:MAG: Ankyrin-2 [Peltula sp. TS41687]
MDRLPAEILRIILKNVVEDCSNGWWWFKTKDREWIHDLRLTCRTFEAHLRYLIFARLQIDFDLVESISGKLDYLARFDDRPRPRSAWMERLLTRETATFRCPNGSDVQAEETRKVIDLSKAEYSRSLCQMTAAILPAWVICNWLYAGCMTCPTKGQLRERGIQAVPLQCEDCPMWPSTLLNGDDLALHLMVYRQDRDKVSSLLERAESNITNTCRPFPTALMMATDYNDAHMVALLLQHDADVRPHDHRGASPLHVASANGNVPLLRALLEKDAHRTAVDPKDERIAYPLHLALRRGHQEAVRLLLGHGPSGRKFGRGTSTWELSFGANAVEIAIRNGDAEMLRLLLQEDLWGPIPERNCCDYSGPFEYSERFYDAVGYALLKGQESLAALLMSHGRQVLQQDQYLPSDRRRLQGCGLEEIDLNTSGGRLACPRSLARADRA